MDAGTMYWLSLYPNSPHLTDTGNPVPIPLASLCLNHSGLLVERLQEGGFRLFVSFAENPVGCVAVLERANEGWLHLHYGKTARLDGLPDSRGFVRVKPVPCTQEDAEVAQARLLATIRSQIRYESHPIRKKMWRELLAVADPGDLADRVAGRSVRSVPEYQAYLQETDVARRLQLVRRWCLESRTEMPEPPPRSASQRYAIEDLALWRRTLQNCQLGQSSESTDRTNPVCHQNSLFMSVFSSGAFRSLDADTGNVRWTRKSEPFAKRPLVCGESVIACCTNHLHCLEATTGKVLWKYRPYPKEAGEHFYTSAVVDDRAVYWCDNSGFIHCLDLASGRLLWKVQGSTRGYATTPHCQEELLVTLSHDNEICGHRTFDGSLAWSTQVGDSWVCQILPYQGNLLVPLRSSLLQIDLNGQPLHEWKLPEHESYHLCVADDMLLIATSRTQQPGTLRAYRGPQLIWEIPAAPYISGLHWNSATGLVYEVGYSDITALRPTTGERIFQLYSKRGFWAFDPPDIRDNIMYIFVGSQLFAIRHPEY